MLQMMAKFVTDRVAGSPCRGGYFNQVLCVDNIEISGLRDSMEVVETFENLVLLKIAVIAKRDFPV
jgi:hypothetical protein